MQPAAPLAPGAANFEQIVEVCGEPVGDRQPQGLRTEAAHEQALEAALVPEELRPPQMHRVVRQDQLPVAIEVGVREIADEGRVVVPQRRRQEDRPAPLYEEIEMGEVARVLVIEPIDTAFGRNDVALLVEHGERIPVLERARAPGFERNSSPIPTKNCPSSASAESRSLSRAFMVQLAMIQDARETGSFLRA